MAAANSEAQSLRESLGIRAVYISWIVGIFTPHTSYLGTKKYPSFTKWRTCGGLKKDPSAKYVTQVRPPSVPERKHTKQNDSYLFVGKVGAFHRFLVIAITIVFSVSRKEIVTLLKTVFSTLTVAMRYEPANARFFATEVRKLRIFTYLLNPFLYSSAACMHATFVLKFLLKPFASEVYT